MAEPWLNHGGVQVCERGSEFYAFYRIHSNKVSYLWCCKWRAYSSFVIVHTERGQCQASLTGERSACLAEVSVTDRVYGNFQDSHKSWGNWACTNSVQALFFPPPTHKSLGTRLVTTLFSGGVRNPHKLSYMKLLCKSTIPWSHGYFISIWVTKPYYNHNEVKLPHRVWLHH